VLLLLLAGCGGENGGGEGGREGGAASSAPSSAPAQAGLSQEELEKGIGPVRTVELGEVNDELAERGEEIFKLKCSACHRLEDRYVGPPLGTVLERRTPEFVMNMLLNTNEMVQRHPTVRELLGQYYTPMPDQGLTEQDARAVLEYLREEAHEAREEGEGRPE